VSISNEARIYNFLVIVQLMISALTGQEGFLWFIGVGWYSFWVIFPLPDWWTYMFLMRKNFTNWPQEETCAVFHFGSFWWVGLLVISLKTLITVFWPLGVDFVDMIPLPGRMRRKVTVHDDEKSNHTA
jgi:hypothetical protein